MSFEKYKVKKEPVIQAAPPKPVAEANLLDFGDEPIVPGQPPAITQKMNVETDQSEDWGDFSAAPQSPQGQDFSSPTQTIANTALPTAIRQNQNVTSPTNNSSFANFASFPATIKSNPAAPPNVPTNNATNADPLFNLVSLEADALSSRSNNRKDAPGPSLNQIQASQIDALSKDIWRGNR